MPADIDWRAWLANDFVGQDVAVSLLALINVIATDGLIVSDNYGRKFTIRLADRQQNEDSPSTDDKSNVRVW